LIQIELPLRKIIAMHDELVGSDQNSGILEQDLTMIERFWLNDLVSRTSKIRKEVTDLRDDMIRRRGKPDQEGNSVIKATMEIEIEINGELRKALAYTEEFLAFQKEYEELLSEEVKIEVSEKILFLIPEVMTNL
jgi:hypothetical protein